MATVSIVSSVYNKAPYLEKCLDSLIKQSFADIEIILVDNASTDGGADIIERYRARDDRIRVITLARNIGSAGGIDAGISHVTSDYFTICDADDYIDLDYIEILYSEIISGGADIAMCANDYVSPDKTSIPNILPGAKRLVFVGEEIKPLLPKLLDPCGGEYLEYNLSEIGAAWGKMYKTDTLKRASVNYEPGTNIFSDWLFNLRVLKQTGKLVYTNRAVYHNFASENSVTRSKAFNARRCDEIEHILLEFKDECEGAADDGGTLRMAYSRLSAHVILNLIAYYRKYYKTLLGLKDEIKYINRISGIIRSAEVDIGECGKSVRAINKARFFLLKHKIPLAEIAYTLLCGARKNRRK